MLVSPDFQQLKCERSHALEHDVAVELEDDATTVVTRRRMPADGFPDLARSLVGEAVDVVETTRWDNVPEADGSRTATLHLEIPRTPVALTGSVRLESVGEGTRQTVEGELRVAVPFVGGRMERLVAPVITDAVRLEGRVGQEWRAQA